MGTLYVLNIERCRQMGHSREKRHVVCRAKEDIRGGQRGEDISWQERHFQVDNSESLDQEGHIRGCKKRGLKIKLRIMDSS